MTSNAKETRQFYHRNFEHIVKNARYDVAFAKMTFVI